jgi:DNA-binding LytR/AlgR family response regulator
MRKLKCLVVDDEPLAMELISGYVRQTPFLEFVEECNSAINAMEVLEKEKIDLLFLDIQMPDLTGIDFSRTLKNGPRVIFTTAYEKYAIEGYKVDALDYLLKPISYQEFLAAALKAKNWYELLEKNEIQIEDDFLLVKSEYKIIRINFIDILYVESMRDYLKIYVSNQTRPILTLMSMKSLEAKLPAPQFMRVHRSYLVNTKQIQNIERNHIVFNKVFIPISDSYKENFERFLEKGQLG